MEHILIDLPTKLETERLSLRPYQYGDGREYFRLLQENKHHLEEDTGEVKTIRGNWWMNYTMVF